MISPHVLVYLLKDIDEQNIFLNSSTAADVSISGDKSTLKSPNKIHNGFYKTSLTYC